MPRCSPQPLISADDDDDDGDDGDDDVNDNYDGDDELRWWCGGVCRSLWHSQGDIQVAHWHDITIIVIVNITFFIVIIILIIIIIILIIVIIILFINIIILFITIIILFVIIIIFFVSLSSSGPPARNRTHVVKY